MKKLILISILIGANLFAIANDNNKNVSKKKHKLNYNEFMTKYGDNDTAAVIIEIFFDKRNNAAKGQMSFLPISTGIAIILPPVGVGLMAISTPLFINGMIVNQKYNRKKLMNILEEYHYNNELPLKLKNQVIAILEAEDDLKEIDYVKNNTLELRKVRDQTTQSKNKEVVVLNF
ncbi:MAG: hypothetical protein K0B10_11155 [Vicingaceae bacterium]|nr:hypothetical protein [Vicingaceae bacterium]